MKKTLIFSLGLLLLCSCNTQKIVGVVTNNNGYPIKSAYVSADCDKAITQTNKSGTFVLRLNCRDLPLLIRTWNKYGIRTFLAKDSTNSRLLHHVILPDQ